MNYHQNDVAKQDSLQTGQHFRLPGKNLNRHSNDDEMLNDTNIDKELLKYGLKNLNTFVLKN